MYAIFQNGNKQYRVNEGQIIRLEKLKIALGLDVKFDNILMIENNSNVKIGTPFIPNAFITGEIIFHGRDKKIKIIKFRRRKHYRRQQGHRQSFTDVKIKKIIS